MNTMIMNVDLGGESKQMESLGQHRHFHSSSAVDKHCCRGVPVATLETCEATDAPERTIDNRFEKLDNSWKANSVGEMSSETLSRFDRLDSSLGRCDCSCCSTSGS